MNVKKPIIAGLMSLATFMPVKAQRAVQFISETGVSGAVNKELSFYSGINFEFAKSRNYTDFYAGMSVKPDKKASFVALAINNFPWTKNISSWARETFVASDREVNSTVEIAPIRANKRVGKFNFSLSPAYALYNDFKTGTAQQGLNPMFHATYSLSPRQTIWAEAKYSSEPSNNLFKTHFGKFKDNFSFMISYLTAL